MLPAVAAAAVSCFVYFTTLSMSAGWHDSAELALVAWQLGASHAPGSPLHSLFGHFMTLFYAEPFRGTTLLSALTASASAGVLVLLINDLKHGTAVALPVALIYAFSFQVWGSATVTEVYSLGMLCLSITLLYAWRWCANGRRSHFIIWTMAYAFALGAYFANILLLPAFAFLIYFTSNRKVRDMLSFAVFTGLAILLIGVANYFLAKNAPPISGAVPDSILDMILYMSGSQHAPLQIRDAGFVLTRFLQHLEIFSRSMLFIGIPLGLLGAAVITRMHRVFGSFLLMVFAIYMAYYTVFGPGDYFMMVLPAYFIFSVWIAFGVFGLLDYVGGRSMRWACRLLPVLLVAGLLIYQFDGRRLMARSLDAEAFADSTFASLARDAVAITGFKEFAALNYFQEVDSARTDIRFVLPARSDRHYRFGEVSDYVELVGSAICSAAVYTTKDLPDLPSQYELQKDNTDGPWMRITGAGGKPPEFCR